jgi:hypothetical protein
VGDWSVRESIRTAPRTISQRSGLPEKEKPNSFSLHSVIPVDPVKLIGDELPILSFTCIPVISKSL